MLGYNSEEFWSLTLKEFFAAVRGKLLSMGINIEEEKQKYMTRSRLEELKEMYPDV